MKRAVLVIAVLMLVPATAQARLTPVSIATQEFSAAAALGFSAPEPGNYIDADIAVDAGRCRRVSHAKWLCPFKVHGRYTTWDDQTNVIRLRADCHAKAFVTRDRWRFSARLSSCLGSWLP